MASSYIIRARAGRRQGPPPLLNLVDRRRATAEERRLRQGQPSHPLSIPKTTNRELTSLVAERAGSTTRAPGSFWSAGTGMPLETEAYQHNVGQFPCLVSVSAMIDQILLPHWEGAPVWQAKGA